MPGSARLSSTVAAGLAGLAGVAWGPGALAQIVPRDPDDDAAFEAALPPLDATRPGQVVAPRLVTEGLAVDPRLAAPLTPLTVFEQAPLVATAPTADAPLAEVGYRLQVEGLKPLGLQDRFEDLSLLLEDRKRSAPASQVRLRAEHDVTLIERLLESEGYYDRKVSLAFEPATGRAEVLDVHLAVEAGGLYRLGDVAVRSTDPIATGIAREALRLSSGAPLVAARIEAAEAAASLRLPQAGYPFAELGRRDVVLDGQTHLADYTLPLTAGPHAAFGVLHVEGSPFTARHVARLARFSPGELYDARRLEDLRQALVATSLVASVAIAPRRPDRVKADGLTPVDIDVRQSPAKPRSLAASAGYSTVDGYRLAGRWTHRNLFPPEGALSLDAVLGAQEARVAASFRRSNAGRRDRSVRAALQLSREDRDAYQARSVSVTAGVARESTPLWQKRWTYSLGAELTRSRETAAADAAPAGRTYAIAALPAQVGYDRSDDLLDPNRGFRLGARLSPELAWRGARARYGRLVLDASGYSPLGDRLVLAARARWGSIVGAELGDIAPSRRLYGGGGGSVRGFGYQDLGPRGADGDPTGGRGLAEASLEARFRWRDFGVVPFIDAGQVYEGARPRLSDLRFGVGLGGRYYTPFGPLRVDIATPLARRRGEPRVALYISIGQAF